MGYRSQSRLQNHVDSGFKQPAAGGIGWPVPGPLIYGLALLLLGPVLYAQGIYVRRVTPRLPEPDGIRAGKTGCGTELRLFIVGDSAAAGVGVGQQDQALSGCVVSSLSGTHAVTWKVLARSGDSSRHLLDRLRAAPAEDFETAVVSIGVNDVTALTPAGTWVSNLAAIVDVLKEKFAARRIFLSSIPPMHLFPALPNPLRWWLGLRARQFNALMQAFAQRDASCVFVAIPYPADHGFIAPDGFHPGRLAYRLWGEHVADMIRGTQTRTGEK